MLIFLKNQSLLLQVLEVRPYFFFVGISEHLDVAEIVVVVVWGEVFFSGEDVGGEIVDYFLVVSGLEDLIDHGYQTFHTAAIDHKRIVVPVYPIVDVSLDLHQLTMLEGKFPETSEDCVLFVHDFVPKLNEAKGQHNRVIDGGKTQKKDDKVYDLFDFEGRIDCNHFRVDITDDLKDAFVLVLESEQTDKLPKLERI